MALEVTDVSFIYPGGGGEVLRDISLACNRGQILAIMGPSGCGKSTLLNVVAGVLRPRAGAVVFERKRLDRVGYVFQSAALLPWLTVEENALFGVMLANGGRVPAAKREQAHEILGRYGLRRRTAAYPNVLSGGMQQRVALIRAVLSDHSVLLLDEPFSGADLALRETLERDVWQMVEAQRLASVLVTHDLDQAVRLADRIIILGPAPATVVGCVPVSLSRSERWGGSPAALAAMAQIQAETRRILYAFSSAP